jgi:acyl carrier protein phosphodiesterase
MHLLLRPVGRLCIASKLWVEKWRYKYQSMARLVSVVRNATRSRAVRRKRFPELVDSTVVLD